MDPTSSIHRDVESWRIKITYRECKQEEKKESEEDMSELIKNYSNILEKNFQL